MVEKKEICQNLQLPKLKGLGGSPASVYILGDIDESLLGEAVMPLLEYASGDDPIEIYLSTDGGEPQIAMVIADIIERLEVPTTIVLLGSVASAGFLIAVSGANNENVCTVAFPSTRMMWHSGEMSLMDGYALHLMWDRLDYERSNRERLIEFLIDHTKLTREQFEEYERQEKWFFPEELLELGIIDEIL